jgi:hypothetical protein
MGVGEEFPTDDHPPVGIDGKGSTRMSQEGPGEAGEARDGGKFPLLNGLMVG